MFLYVKHSLQYFQENFVFNNPDTDVFILLLMVSKKKINKVKQSLKSAYSSGVDVRIERFTKALLSLHTFTNCDTVCAFAGLGKRKVFRI